MLGLILVFSCATIPKPAPEGPLKGLTITLDPGHGDTEAYDDFRVGPAGDREEWINLKVAKKLQKLLLHQGAQVVMTRTDNRDVNLGGRASVAIKNDSDFFVSIHHNGSVNDTTLDYPLVYIWGDARRNPASVDLAQSILNSVEQNLAFETPIGAGVYSDFLIYSAGTAVLRNTYPRIPGIIGEMGFFTNAAGEQRMRDDEALTLEAEGYLAGILAYTKRGIPKAELLKPVGDDYLRPESSEIIFRLTDGLGGHAFDVNSLLVLVNDDTIPHQWDKKSGVLTVTPPRCSHETIQVQVFGRNELGNALHPREWDLLTMIGKEKRWQGPWHAAFGRADSLRGLLNPGDSNFVVQLDATIYWYEQALRLQPVNPRAAEAEFRLGEMHVLKLDWLGDESARGKAVTYFDRVIGYYPTSNFVKSARDELFMLERVF
ncbi:MAG: N-acetylmuramoyl-L-alanine amidase [Lentisphaeria bacterium]|nr:N-acetylmuramoyl-L-alanine amidase [Candidatus Neomarinimicrobiota bacterium]MCF7841904.1 N-acetylmuramoyl-L-alanine amidase [Lentisphaeria bacterium]